MIPWTEESQKDRKTLIGLLIFLELAHRAKISANPDNPDWPTLLWLINEDSVYLDSIAALLRNALNLKDTRKLARDLLRGWTYAADDDSRLYLPLENLVRDLKKGTDREAGRLHFYLRHWSMNTHRPCESAKQLLAKLSW
jgi:hypothetical protein